MLVLFGLYKITAKQTVAPVRFFQETVTIWRLQMQQTCFLWRVHMRYMRLFYFACTDGRCIMVQMEHACFIWRVQMEDICLFHLACTDGTCLFYLACTDWIIYVLVVFSVCRRKMLVLFGVYKITGTQVRFFQRNIYHLACTDGTGLFSLSCTHGIYVFVLFGVYTWKIRHGGRWMKRSDGWMEEEGAGEGGIE